MKFTFILFISLFTLKSFDAAAQLSSFKPVQDTTAAVQTIANKPSVLATETQPKPVGNFTSLPSLKATVSQENVFLNWSTTSENGIDHFGIRYSTNGTDWVELTTVKATGNLETGINYRWPHANPLMGMNYYQIEIVNKNGKSTYSDIAKANITGRANEASFIVYPNPSYIGIIKIMGSNTKGLTIINSTGEDVTGNIKVNTFNDNGGEFDISLLPKGTYYLHLNGKVQSFSKLD